MSQTRPGLVLHVVGASQPLRIALDETECETLAEQLPVLMSSGETKSLTTADGGRFAVNFGHVVTAHVELNRSDANAYGAPSRGTGFGQ